MTIANRSLSLYAMPRSNEALRFSLADLLVLVTVFALALAMVSQLGIYGATVCFIGVAVLTMVIYPNWRPDEPDIQQAAFDVGWGIVMPLVCLGMFVIGPRDILVRSTDDHGGIRTVASSPFAWFFSFQIMLFGLWYMFGRLNGRLAGFFFGALIPGTCVWGFVGALVVPFTLIWILFAGISLVGLTPALTALVYGRAMFDAADRAGRADSDETLAFTALGGFMFATAVPVALSQLVAASF